jgi:hypothetical protein
MNTNPFVEAAQRRRSRIAEFRALFWAGVIVFAGLLVAALYCLLTHQIPV